MTIVTLLNQKGGVGKTSTCHHLAGTLARGGLRVLLVDNDPQASLTQGFWGPERTEGLDPSNTVWAVYTGEALAEQVIVPTGFAGIDLVAGSWRLVDLNVPRPVKAELDRQRCLRSFLADEVGPDRYDLVLIDCPPNLLLCAWAALAASDALVVPLQAEDYGVQGLKPVLEFVQEAQAWINPRLRTLGLLITMFDRRASLPKHYEAVLREAHGELIFAAHVPRSVQFAEAILLRKPLAWYRPRGVPAVAMRAVAGELLGRLGLPPLPEEEEAEPEPAEAESGEPAEAVR